jgi:hypothetical protein
VAGDAAGAVTAYKALLADSLRVLGPDHLDTLADRHRLARWRGKAGDAAGAATATEEVVAHYLRVLGRDDSDTLTARSTLAFWRGEAGDARRSPRTRRCWPTLCGWRVATTPKPWPFAIAWRTGGSGRVRTPTRLPDPARVGAAQAVPPKEWFVSFRRGLGVMPSARARTNQGPGRRCR